MSSRRTIKSYQIRTLRETYHPVENEQNKLNKTSQRARWHPKSERIPPNLQRLNLREVQTKNLQFSEIARHKGPSKLQVKIPILFLRASIDRIKEALASQ